MVTAILIWMMCQTQLNEGHNRFVETLEMVQLFGSSKASDPSFDQPLKVAIAKAVKDEFITQEELGDFMNESSFRELGGSDGRIDVKETEAALQALSRVRSTLHPELRKHADYLTTTFDLVDQQHREANTRLSQWIAESYRDDQELSIIVVCTGNSRRSMLGSSMGNLAAAYYGLNKLRFYSGGTKPTAFNARTIRSLSEIGFKIDAIGEEAARGEPTTANPKYRVAWGNGLEAIEFSKHYGDSQNPRSGFAALMVCSEADDECPSVKGAALRISLPYLDPKIYDGDRVEQIKYSERRDDIGRFMLSAIARARAQIVAK